MKTFSFLLPPTLLTLLFLGCAKNKDPLKEKVNSYQTNVNRDPFEEGIQNAKWKADAFPLPLFLSDQFNSQESEAIRKMAAIWNQSYYWMEIQTVPTPNLDYENFERYKDNILGIYKSLTSFPARYATALAVTKYVGYLHRANDQYYMEIEHVDIIINYRYFTFDILNKEQTLQRIHDLSTVVLHEMGHVLGLQHSKNLNSIMFPTLPPGKVNHSPSDLDFSILKERYDPSSSVNLDAESELEPPVRYEFVVPCYHLD